MPKFLEKRRLNALAVLMQKGDAQAAEDIFGYFSPLFFGHFAKRVLNREVAEDLVQDVFLRIVKNIQNFDERSGDLPAWVWRIAKNRLIDYYREKKSVSFCDLEIVKDMVASEADNLNEKILAEKICLVAKGLNSEDQNLFTLRFISDLSYKEMAELTDKSEESLRVAVCRIKKKLKKMING